MPKAEMVDRKRIRSFLKLFHKFEEEKLPYNRALNIVGDTLLLKRLLDKGYFETSLRINKK